MSIFEHDHNCALQQRITLKTNKGQLLQKKSWVMVSVHCTSAKWDLSVHIWSLRSTPQRLFKFCCRQKLSMKYNKGLLQKEL